MEKIITEENYADFLATNGPLVIDFSATWCGPCQRVKPIIKELAEEYDGRVSVGLCDVDDNETLTAKYGVRNIPTILFIKNGEVVDKIVGAATKAAFHEKFEELL